MKRLFTVGLVAACVALSGCEKAEVHAARVAAEAAADKAWNVKIDQKVAELDADQLPILGSVYGTYYAPSSRNMVPFKNFRDCVTMLRKAESEKGSNLDGICTRPEDRAEFVLNKPSN